MTADFDFDTPRERRGTDSEKWQRWAGRDVLPLWVADMDFAAPPPVIDALRRRVEHGVFGYARRTRAWLACWLRPSSVRADGASIPSGSCGCRGWSAA
jgi:bifunctional pyridoxal-dependent enzyme with beta-cystathionase and maltose regulon repressor activities